MTIPDILPITLRYARLVNDLSLWEVAARSGVSKAKVQSIERGLVEPTPEETDKLEKFFSMPIGDLLAPVPKGQFEPELMNTSAAMVEFVETMQICDSIVQELS